MNTRTHIRPEAMLFQRRAQPLGRTVRAPATYHGFGHVALAVPVPVPYMRHRDCVLYAIVRDQRSPVQLPGARGRQGTPCLLARSPSINVYASELIPVTGFGRARGIDGHGVIGL
jgi:hypothetical protein